MPELASRSAVSKAKKHPFFFGRKTMKTTDTPAKRADDAEVTQIAITGTKSADAIVKSFFGTAAPIAKEETVDLTAVQTPPAKKKSKPAGSNESIPIVLDDDASAPPPAAKKAKKTKKTNTGKKGLKTPETKIQRKAEATKTVEPQKPTGTAKASDASAFDTPHRGNAASPQAAAKSSNAAAADVETITLPFKSGGLTLLSMGSLEDVDDVDKYHTKTYVWPVGYCCTRTFFNYRSSNVLTKVTYTCEIIPGPQFKVTAINDSGNPSIAKSATGAWSEILTRVNKRRAQEGISESKAAVSGPDYFGLTHKSIRRLLATKVPGVAACSKLDRSFLDAAPPAPPARQVVTEMPNQMLKDLVALVEGSNASVDSMVDTFVAKHAELAEGKPLKKSLARKEVMRISSRTKSRRFIRPEFRQQFGLGPRDEAEASFEPKKKARLEGPKNGPLPPQLQQALAKVLEGTAVGLDALVDSFVQAHPAVIPGVALTKVHARKEITRLSSRTKTKRFIRPEFREQFSLGPREEAEQKFGVRSKPKPPSPPKEAKPAVVIDHARIKQLHEEVSTIRAEVVGLIAEMSSRGRACVDAKLQAWRKTIPESECQSFPDAHVPLLCALVHGSTSTLEDLVSQVHGTLFETGDDAAEPCMSKMVLQRKIQEVAELQDFGSTSPDETAALSQTFAASREPTPAASGVASDNATQEASVEGASNEAASDASEVPASAAAPAAPAAPTSGSAAAPEHAATETPPKALELKAWVAILDFFDKDQTPRLRRISRFLTRVTMLVETLSAAIVRLSKGKELSKHQTVRLIKLRRERTTLKAKDAEIAAKAAKEKQAKLEKQRQGSKAITSFFSQKRKPQSSGNKKVKSLRSRGPDTSVDLHKKIRTIKQDKELSTSVLLEQLINRAKKSSAKSASKWTVVDGMTIRRRQNRPKFLLFAEDTRPAWYGCRNDLPHPTRTRLSGRQPLRQDVRVFNYDIDSEEEWEEGEGESLSDDDNDDDANKEEEANYEVDDWLCEDDEIVYKGPGAEEEEDDAEGGAEIIPRKYTPKQAANITAQLPVIIGPLWNLKPEDVTDLETFRCQALLSLPFRVKDTFAEKVKEKKPEEPPIDFAAMRKELAVYIHAHPTETATTIVNNFVAAHPKLTKTYTNKQLRELATYSKQKWFLQESAQKEFNLAYPEPEAEKKVAAKPDKSEQSAGPSTPERKSKLAKTKVKNSLKKDMKAQSKSAEGTKSARPLSVLDAFKNQKKTGSAKSPVKRKCISLISEDEAPVPQKKSKKKKVRDSYTVAPAVCGIVAPY